MKIFKHFECTTTLSSVESKIIFSSDSSGFEMLHPDMKKPTPEMAIWTKHLIKTASINDKLKILIKVPLQPYKNPESSAKKYPE